MHRPIFGHSFVVLVAPILLSVIAFNLLNRKKTSLHRDKEDADTGAAGSSAAPADTSNGASSSSTAPTGDRYEVFLSFRGPDTRKGFTDHLYNGLVDAGIHTFLDNNELRQGEEIGPDLLEAIKSSKILIPVLSVNYGSSKWCLDELIQITECKKSNMGQLVLPIFYKVAPAHVRYQIGSFGEAFRKKKRRFDPTILKKYKQALTAVSNLKGWEADGYEGGLVKTVVQKVLSELKKRFELVIPENLVGIDSHVEKVMKDANNNSGATLFIGIYGIGGIGKTTLAKTIFNKLSNQFEYRSFISDIRELCKRNGLEYLQTQLISDICGPKIQFHNKDEATMFLSSMFKEKKVLILLDDVDNDDQLKILAGNHNWFHSGSRILITTRNKSILDNAGVDYNYEREEMDENQSLILFSRHAFRSDSPPSEFEDLAHDVVSTTGGLPLALEVLGSFLCGKEPTLWRGTIKKLREVAHWKVRQKLRISYDALEHGQKQIFLDIACFLIGTDGRIASYMWDACGFFPEEGIAVLRFMSLIKVGDNDEFRMHDQLRDLGREIVREENQQEPRYRSRLWDSKEALKVLKENKGTEKIEAICLNQGRRIHTDEQFKIFDAEQFKNLTCLRYLDASGAYFRGDFKNSIEELKWLRWQYCPSTFEANNFHAKELIVLNMSWSTISDEWQGWSSMMAEKLKFLNLTGCESLKSTVFLSAFKNLEVLILRYCRKLVQIDSSIGDMTKLVQLILDGCDSLKVLPDSIGALQNLEILSIRVQGIIASPNSIARLRKLQRLNASGINFMQTVDIAQLNQLTTLSVRHSNNINEVRDLFNLKILNITECASIKRLDLTKSKGMKTLCVENCINLVEIQSLDRLEFLEELKISRCISIERLDLAKFEGLKKLDVTCCEKLVEFQGFDRLKLLKDLYISHCPLIERLDLSKSESFMTLCVEDCTSLVEIQGDRLTFLEELHICRCISIEKLELSKFEGLKKLDVRYCENLAEIQVLERLKFLEELCIFECTIEKLDFSKFEGLKILYARSCKNLVEIQGLDRLEFLENVEFSWCTSIKRLNFSKSEGLKSLNVQYCENLVEIQGLDRMMFLEDLCISGCVSIERLDLPKSEDLRTLCAEDCRNLLKIQGLNRLKFLEEVDISGCVAIERLDLSKSEDLKILCAQNCENLVEIRGLDKLEFLKELDISGCTSFVRLPNLCCFDTLRKLAINGCDRLYDVQSLERFGSCKTLSIEDCKSLEKLPYLSNFHNLQELFLSNCPELQEIPGLEELTSLKKIAILGCSSIEISLDLSSCTNLLSLVVQNCVKLTELRGLEKLEQLVELDIFGCKSLETIPELSGTQLYQNYEKKPYNSYPGMIEFWSTDMSHLKKTSE